MRVPSERTFVIAKPDSVQRGLIGDLIKRLEGNGLKLVAAKFTRASEKKLREHYDKDDAWYLAKGTKRKDFLISKGVKVDADREPIEFGRDIITNIVTFMRSTPVLMMVWEGNEAVAVVKKQIGSTEPTTSDVGTFRGDHQHDSYLKSDTEQRALRNLAHCSDKVDEAQREIGIWFDADELQDYRHINEAVLEDPDLDGKAD